MVHIDTQALQELIDTHGGALILYARQWCRAPEDVVQEVLIELLRQEPVPDNLPGWLFTATRRRAMNQARSEERRTRRQQQASERRPSWFEPAETDLDGPLDYESLLTRLPRLEREIVVARIWGERTFVEIAALVEQSTSAVHRRYQKALSDLERMINEEPSRQTDESELPLS